MRDPRLIVVSNRLPVSVCNENGRLRLHPSSGGLVTALNAVFREHSGCWVGWTGTDCSPDVEACFRQVQPSQVAVVPVYLSPEEQSNFYRGFSNEIVWPLFHDLQSRCNFEPAYWDAYLAVNERFAATVVSVARPDDFIWVHDYHLVRTARYLRERGVSARLAFFQHIPFPGVDIFEKMPWRKEFLQSMLHFDLLGFQTERDCENFITCARRLLNARAVKRDDGYSVLSYRGRLTVTGTFPIGIDFREFAEPREDEEASQIAEGIRASFGARKFILGVDRLDYTKGIPEKLRAFRTALETYPDLRRNVSLVQVVVPSREEIPNYNTLKHEIERLVSEINGQYTDAGWIPIHFMYRHLSRAELLAFYRVADVALVTPLKDGMNLVAKEFCAVQRDSPGVLILSEFAGAAAQLRRGALMVNPNHFADVAAAIHSAIHMHPGERAERMSGLRERIRAEDVHRWSAEFISACESSGARHPLLHFVEKTA